MRLDRGFLAFLSCLALIATGCARLGEEPAGLTSPALATPRESSQSPIMSGDPRITAEIPYPKDATNGGVAIGDGSTWVGLQGQGPGGTDSVMRIDLATNEVVATIPVTSVPWRKRIAVTDNAVWVASDGLIERIDPATNAVVASVEIPNRDISALAADATALWAVTLGDAGGILVRIDPATNDIVSEIQLGPQIAGYEDEVQIGDGAIWILGVRWIEHEDTEYGSDLIRVDPATNAIAARIPVGGFQMVVAADAVWVRFPADGAFDGTYKGGQDERWLWTRVDVATNEPSEPFPFEDNGLQLVTPDALWSVGYDEHEYVRVTRFDPNTLAVTERSEPIKSYFHDAALDPVSGTVWVSAISNIVRIDTS